MTESQTRQITIYGEVLFDCFNRSERAGQADQAERVLGGAPFNVCWHLQALGDQPIFISRVGEDQLGEQILQQARSWGISTDNIQQDKQHPTGQVQVSLIDNEPHYDIKADSAYDFIEQACTKLNQATGILYHGSLALRSDYAKQQFRLLVEAGQWEMFVDVNLRAPWWDRESLFEWLGQARWIKLNVDELRELGFMQPDLKLAMHAFMGQFGCEQVIVTQGADGALVLTPTGFFGIKPERVDRFVDTVGAGDAFTAIYIHGLIKNWPIEKTLSTAQTFASKVVGIRGATPHDQSFYQCLG
ncbi:PfkB family carbohydrate kinase [Thiomicrorhabdus sp. zzn3]|uniref:PfkB family carbohydrate kinase n=1 Tax=Thiomicrorhabdus sp. zzn3 TaxID=3039775 RepID=UPI002436E8A8|nr:PfkB family carbohydrate kinase [Thiomicrorhabdus sp. zzn3]MDG6778267.1 PfkB family carbohydrate kinase [Thiomicrorhabdus sp. zzn3]